MRFDMMNNKGKTRMLSEESAVTKYPANPGSKMTKSMTIIIEPTPEGNSLIGITGTHYPKQKINVKLEPEFWTALSEICIREQSSIHAVCTAVYMTKSPGLSMDRAVRLFISEYFHCAATEEGHARAGHGTSYISLKYKQSIH
jgi:predicted DNA-binding ribbon-helix-helix protein